jgi:hypothetical protein
MTENEPLAQSDTLPPNGGKYERLKAKSTDRHRRETAFKKTVEANQMAGCHHSVTTWKRMCYVVDFGSPELVKALDDKKISISRAYNLVQQQQIHESLEAIKKRRQEEKCDVDAELPAESARSRDVVTYKEAAKLHKKLRW